MSQWVRLWEDMPTDPKWRVVAKRAGRPLCEVLSVFLHMMTTAGHAADRGSIEGWNDEDVAAAIDLETDHVTAIREAMQGKTLDGDRLSGWAKRQPIKEDGAAERARVWREQKRLDDERAERERTQTNASELNAIKPNASELPEEKREDTDPERKKDGPPAPLEISRPPDADLYRRGKEVLGPKSGGLIKKLLTSKGNSVPQARAAIETASEKADPLEYIGAIIHNRERETEGKPKGTYGVDWG